MEDGESSLANSLPSSVSTDTSFCVLLVVIINMVNLV